MKKNKTFILLIITLLTVFIAACENPLEMNSTDSNDKVVVNEELNESNEETYNGSPSNNNDNVSDESNNQDTASTDNFEQVEDPNDSEENDPLASYSVAEIEYARVWLEVVNNRDIETLNVGYISAGEPVGQYEGKSVKYPEDVVHLFTDFLAGGNVFYSSNGDGSITLYDVPTRWPTPEDLKEERNQTMEEYTQSIIDNPQQVMIDPGDDEEVENIIKKIEVVY
ncbi:hypothetical protein [Salinicoccus kekensis]|uniref:Lipoprotein n=1 Tax=Salinicoccus kekensis TaxID=714307 RepID=A0A285U6V8_9STAP|nr:hypothetical protein [Salinicoccus kekensis]SOC37562.1 hypothetical protein SAMN05878391_0008 [Salinicoccus kekensis]